MAERRMNDDAGGFIQDNRVLVFVEDIELALFRNQRGRPLFGKRQLDAVVRAEPEAAFDGGSAVDRDAAFFNILCLRLGT